METTTPVTSATPATDVAPATSAPLATDAAPRVDQFKSEVAEMKLKTGNATRERVYGVLGLVVMLVGVGGAFFCYVSSRNLSDARDIQSTLILAVGFVALTLLGLGIFLRFAIANFLRMWLLRQLYEGQANTERMVQALEQRS